MQQQSPLRELSVIDLRLLERLQDQDFRREWFRAELEDSVPATFKALRERRALNQTQLAKLIGTQQPAISRFESSCEAVWEFDFLVRMAEAMDARLRVVVEPFEDVISEYDEAPHSSDAPSVLEGAAKRHSQKSLDSASALGSRNESDKRRAEPANLASPGETGKGSSVLTGRSERSDPSVQFPALPRQGSVARQQ